MVENNAADENAVNENAQAARTELVLSATFKKMENELHVSYKVKNGGYRDVYLINRLYRTIPELTISPDFIYIHLEKEARAVHLLKKLADLPKGKQVTSPVSPFVTPVRVGEDFSETVHIPLPIQEYREYLSEAPGAEAVYDSVDLTLGYYWRAEGTTEEIRKLGKTEVVMPRTPPGVRPVFGTLQTKPEKIQLPVREPI